MKVIIIGDLHLSDERLWSHKVSCEIVDFIIKHPDNNKDTIWIFEGDIVNQAFISGRVIDLMYQLFSNMLATSFVIVGNHDTKKNKNGDVTLVYDYLTNDAHNLNVAIVDEPFVVTSDNMNFLLLPHDIRGWDYMKYTYEHLDATFTKNHYTAILGHFNDSSIPIPGASINLDYLDTEAVLLGHYHIPSDHYIGSVVPNSIKESGYTRRLISFDKGKRTDLPISPICDYYSVSYPNKLPKTDCKVPIYSIYCCGSEAAARDAYGDIFMYKCSLLPPGLDKKTSEGASSSAEGSSKIETLSVEELFDEWKKEQSAYSERAIELMHSYLF